MIKHHLPWPALVQGRTCELKVLDIGNNSMSAEGAAALARLLHDKTGLEDLNCYMNDIGDQGMEKVGTKCGDAGGGTYRSRG